MLLALVLTALSLCQRVEVSPRVAHPDQPVVVRVAARSGEPGVRIQVRVRLPSGRSAEVGWTDASGEVTFVPTELGTHEFRAVSGDGLEVVAVYEVVARTRRWLYAVFLTPLGLLLVWWNLSKLRRPAST